MSKYQNFIFKKYEFSPNTKKLDLYYSFDDQLNFIESYKFDFDFAQYDPEALNRAIETLFLMAGISYYKAFLPPNIVVEQGSISDETAKFLNKTYQKGLGEFFYLNQIDPNYMISFPINGPTENINSNGRGLLISIGGGKDSLVSVELLRSSGEDLTTWSMDHRPQLENLIREIGLPHLWVERTWDRQLLELGGEGALNGHIPISAIIACVGSVVAILGGKRDVIVSNENSANEADLEYRGVSINHQYSKSIEFERDYQEYTGGLDASPRYYSFLRPFSEVYIAEIFARTGFNKYRGVFSSCNRAFRHDSDHIFWCGECPKCAFTFLALTPFVKREDLEEIWGKNLLLDPSLNGTYEQLLGISGDKPLDCVGEVKESRAAMRLAQKIYPEQLNYKFEIPENYFYKKLSDHSMPSEIYAKLIKQTDLVMKETSS